MRIDKPTTLHDVVTDGIFLAAAWDVAFEQLVGQVKEVEYNFHGEDQEDALVLVRVHSTTGVHDFRSLRVATIDDDHWTWSTAFTDGLEVPELFGTQEFSPQLIQAARTIHAGRPVLIAEQNNHLSVVVVDFSRSPVPWPEVIARGLSTMPAHANERRALTAYQVAEGGTEDLPVEFSGNQIDRFNPAGLTLADVVSDAHYLAVEQELFIHARFPDLRVDLDFPHHTAMVNGTIPAYAHIIGLVRDGSMTWAWADPRLASHPFASSAHNLRAFGTANGIAQLVRGSVPEVEAKRLRLIQAAMRILNVWTLALVRLDEHTTALVLLDSPELQLPALTPAVHEAVLAEPVPEVVNQPRALASYNTLRMG